MGFTKFDASRKCGVGGFMPCFGFDRGAPAKKGKALFLALTTEKAHRHYFSGLSFCTGFLMGVCLVCWILLA